MKKILYLIGISAFFLISSCSNEDIPQSNPEVKTKKYRPVVEGVIGQLTDVNPTIGTRAGVVEDNDDFRDGENFYWHDGDRVKLLFYQNGELKETLIYTATADESQPDRASFTTDEEIDPGTYTVYGLYPADGWTVEDDEGEELVRVNYNLTQQYIPMDDNTSKYLGQYMFMKADAGELVVGGTDPDAINLNFEQLTSVVRVRLSNNNNIDLGPYSQLKRISMGFDGFSRNFYSTAGELEGGITGEALVGSTSNGVNFHDVARVQLTNDDLNGFDLDFFIPVIPTGPLDDSWTNLTLTAFFDDGSEELLRAPSDLSFNINDEVPFLRNGFETGKSYYFILDVAGFVGD